ncbi:ERF family protein [Microbacterium resistens]|uniref:ERF family protein n=1 Tax=Microbacterium resistens TaxID=156977 RepID=A0ABY3RTT8_9MICO|nr:ERF family protein [Microbacterium resistens]UGS26363.1 ERF family protein [Microbacterium resistens]
MVAQKTKTIEADVSIQARTLPHIEHADLPTALAAFQAEVPSVRKDNEAAVTAKDGGRSYRYRYADLSDVTEAALPLLGKHGLSFVAAPTQTKRGFVLKYALRHESGGVIKGTYPLPAASAAPQALGAAITYARRYSLCAVTGVAPGGDDDDAHATPTAEQTAQAQRADRQRKQRSGAVPRDQEFRDRANAAHSREDVAAVWQEARAAAKQGEVTAATLDAIAAIGHARASAEQPETDDGSAAAAEATAEATAAAAHAAERAALGAGTVSA